MMGKRVIKRMQYPVKLVVLALFCLLSSGRVMAVSLADSPLFIGAGAEPNIMFVFDDSGSMRWGFMPDSLDNHFNVGNCSNSNQGWYAGEYLCFYFSNNNRQFLASNYLNKQYYDPSQQYLPPPKGDGSDYPSVSFIDAPVNGYDNNSPKLNLSDNYRAIIDDYFYTSQGGFTLSHNAQAEPAFYFEFIDTVSGCVADPYSGGCYSKVNVANQSAEQKQNFANWFSYYRTRTMSAKAGIGKAFDSVKSDVRVGYGRLNKDGTLVKGVSPFQVDSNRNSFFSWLYGVDPSGSTPLRKSLDDVGKYYSLTDDKGPYSSTPGEDGGSNYECRSSYSVLMTDGYWGGDSPGVGNQDGESGKEYTDEDGQVFGYTKENPFSDDHSNTLADVAMKYWKNDLQPDLANEVAASERNPAFWQHMVTYGVGLGVTGSIDPDTAFKAIEDPSIPIAWGDPANNSEAKIDDLLHAGVNSRGGFFSAAEPAAFAKELSNTLKDIVDRGASSSASIVANSTRLDTDSLVYQARFNPERWSGDLLAFALEKNGDVKTRPKWSAADKLDAMALADRNLLVGTAAGLEKFDASFVGGNSELAAWLRGDRRQEQANGGKFRDRDTRLGDIVNSNPAYSGRQGYGYQHLGDTVQAPKYNVFKSTQNSRREVVLVAANDGMLHGFDADTGDELFAYIPGFVLDELPQLADVNYNHKYFLDGSVIVTDAWVGDADTGGWRTLAVGTSGAGGRDIYVLDITDPVNPELLWERSDNAGGQLGEGINEVSVIPTLIPASGNNPAEINWVLAMGNGYNSSDETARLLLFDLDDGSLEATVPVGVPGGNGLSGITAINASGKKPVADTIYGGDLNGDLWKFDQDKNGDWKVAIQSGKNAVPLFDGEPSQPITSRPDLAKVEFEEDEDRVTMVYFGTGKYLELNDVTDASIQVLYGIKDTSTTVAKDDLLEQTIEFQTELNVDGRSVPIRVVSENIPSDKDNSDDAGWSMELIYKNNAEGERSVVRPVIHETAVLFTTLIPSSDPCSGGGNSWVMALDKGTGGRIAEGVFDLNDDGVVDEDDFVGVNQDKIPPSGFGSDKLLTRPNILGGPGGVDVVHSSDSSGDVTRFNIKGSGELIGRHSWRQLR